MAFLLCRLLPLPLPIEDTVAQPMSMDEACFHPRRMMCRRVCPHYSRDVVVKVRACDDTDTSCIVEGGFIWEGCNIHNGSPGRYHWCDRAVDEAAVDQTVLERVDMLLGGLDATGFETTDKISRLYRVDFFRS
jgi:hypothetical protein